MHCQDLDLGATDTEGYGCVDGYLGYEATGKRKTSPLFVVRSVSRATRRSGARWLN